MPDFLKDAEVSGPCKRDNVVNPIPERRLEFLKTGDQTSFIDASNNTSEKRSLSTVGASPSLKWYRKICWSRKG